MLTRFSVPSLYECSIHLTKVASYKIQPDLVIYNSKILSTYTDRILDNKEIWISKGRIACIKNNGTAKKYFNDLNLYDAQKNILAPGLIDPHMHIESSMMTACSYAEASLLNGTTTIFCDSHEIGNVCDVEGIVLGRVKKIDSGACLQSSNIHSIPSISHTLPIS